jgi:hypothetical protein
MVMLTLSFSAVGAIWLLYALGYDLSVGGWVGLIALLGVDAETGVLMLIARQPAARNVRPLARCNCHRARANAGLRLGFDNPGPARVVSKSFHAARDCGVSDQRPKPLSLISEGNTVSSVSG